MIIKEPTVIFLSFLFKPLNIHFSWHNNTWDRIMRIYNMASSWLHEVHEDNMTSMLCFFTHFLLLSFFLKRPFYAMGHSYSNNEGQTIQGSTGNETPELYWRRIQWGRRKPGVMSWKWSGEVFPASEKKQLCPMLVRGRMT